MAVYVSLQSHRRLHVNGTFTHMQDIHAVCTDAPTYDRGLLLHLSLMKVLTITFIFGTENFRTSLSKNKLKHGLI